MTIKEFYNWAKKNKVLDAEIVYEYFDHNTNKNKIENFEPWLISEDDMNKSNSEFWNAISNGDIKESTWYIRIKQD